MKISDAGEVTTILAAIGAAIMLVVLAAFLTSWLTMLCWNYLAPTFGLPLLGWWQSFVLTFLCSLLFKSTSSSSSSSKK